jgi:predicted RNase H-like HicB family nuclease
MIRDPSIEGEGRVTEYLAVIEQDGEAWDAYVPDLPGWLAAGRSREAVELLIAEAIPLHLALMHENSELVPAPTAVDSTKVAVTPS